MKISPYALSRIFCVLKGNSDKGVKPCLSLQGSGSSQDLEQVQPLLLDLLDADGQHVTKAVISVSWADAQGAFFVAAATACSLHIFTIRRQALLAPMQHSDTLALLLSMRSPRQAL